MTPLRVSVVLPCFEEADGLPALVASLERSLSAACAGHELVIVAAAAGRDGTLAVARDLATRTPNVRVIVQGGDDGGYGRALALGIAAAREPWVLLMDADGQFDPREIERLAQLAATADVVVGYRSPRCDPLGRRLAGRVYATAIRLMTGLRVRDVDCGFKLLRRDLVADLELASRTGVVNAELLAGALARGGRLAELAVAHGPRSGGRARFETALGLPSPREASNMARECLALFRKRTRRG